MAKRKKTLIELEEEYERLKAQLAKKKQALKAKRKALMERFRKREARLLIIIGRLTLESSEIRNGYFCLEVSNELLNTLKEYRDILEYYVKHSNNEKKVKRYRELLSLIDKV